jgi:uncharacterized damage-inducible protein DinB
MTASDAGSEARAADPLAALIEANAQARAALMEAVDALPAARRIERWYGEWSLRDIVGHLAVWQDGWAAALEALARGEPPRIPGFEEGDDGSAFNAARAAEHAEDSWEQAMDLLRQARQRHEAAVRALPAAVEPERYAEGRTAHRMAAMPGNHDRTHIEPIREWRREQQL